VARVRLQFGGAAGEVTGSAHVVTCGGAVGLLDCGLFQGGREAPEKNAQEFPVRPEDLDFVILSHAHIDHCGRLPLLWRRGFRGPVFATPAACDLCRVMLLDSAHIQEADAEWTNRKRKRAGREPIEPLYTVEDAEAALALLRPVPYGETAPASGELRFRFQDAGHILGSAFVELFHGADQPDLLYSGDVGNQGKPIIRDPARAMGAEVLVIEATYGDRAHEPITEARARLQAVVERARRVQGNVIIPAFAVGRAQELLYLLNDLRESGRCDLPVYLDSPLAIAATEAFAKHPECYDADALRHHRAGDDPFAFPGLTLVHTADESRRLNDVSGAVIIAASGMADAGRVRHHLKHNLWREEASVLLVGFQAQGTLGRELLDGAKMVRVLGEEIAVRAQVHVIGALSAHADRGGLLSWVDAMRRRPRRAMIVHAEPPAAESLAAALRERGIDARPARPGETVEVETAEA